MNVKKAAQYELSGFFYFARFFGVTVAFPRSPVSQ
jgi:hypothetical protein